MLYLVRHGETEFNIQFRIQGNCDSPLTTKGIQETKKLANRLKKIDFTKIYTSPLGRTIQTSEIIRGQRNLEIIPISDLQEMNFGDWETKTRAEIPDNEKDNYDNFLINPRIYTAPKNGQDYPQMFEQVQRISEKLFKLAKSQDLLAVTHGGWLRCFYYLYKNMNMDQLSTAPILKNTALTIIDLSKDQPIFILEGDTSHLDA